MNVSRRSFVASSIAAASAHALAGKTLKSIGAQLYTLRGIINDKPLEVLQELEKIGYTEVEVIKGNMDKVWPALTQTKLRPISLHLDTRMFTVDQDKLGPALDDAAKKGFKYLICPYIAQQDRGGDDVIKKLADNLNKSGEKVKQAGGMLCYHNHAFEFAPSDSGKGTLLDLLMANTDPKLVAMEFDIMWSRVAGVDPVSILQRYKGRVPLVHMKNVSGNVKPQFNEKVAKGDFMEVGKGVINIPAVMKAASKAGVKHYIVEQDQTPGNPLDSLRGSFEYLSKLNY
jgi:sugar phosphate isomerase/epimerase